MDESQKILSDLTVYMKYAKYVPELQRRETWDELVTRNMDMHIKKFPKLKKEIKRIEDELIKCQERMVEYNRELNKLKQK
jgi:hypothetical protein